MTDLWTACKGLEQIKPLRLNATRIVESQEQIATMSLVDNYEEQHLLEQLLDESKPTPAQSGKAYHYLIATPFRYPPLKYGSRFGQRNQRGMFYGSLSLNTVFAECAYYRCVFWHGMQTPPPENKINSQHTTFAVSVFTDHGIHLDQQPFAEYIDDISNPNSYQTSQTLGLSMREHQVDAFTFQSARDKQQGINLGVFNLAAIKSKQPKNMQHWSCILTNERATFLSTYDREKVFNFNLADFYINQRLPQPACL